MLLFLFSQRVETVQHLQPLIFPRDDPQRLLLVLLRPLHKKLFFTLEKIETVRRNPGRQCN